MRRLLPLALAAGLVASAAPAALRAQSSQFGVRGPGYPGRALSTGALGSAGSGGLFDPLSSQNAAALGAVDVLTASFSGLQDYRSSENPAGAESGRDTHFPQMAVVGPIRTLPLALGVSLSSYTVRDFTLATTSTIDLRGVPVTATDTLTSRGGINDIRFGAAYRLGRGLTLGAAFHAITGSNRMELLRSFSDSSYLPPNAGTRAEISYAGVGVSAGLVAATGPVELALMARSDGRLRIERDSTLVSRVDLPYTVGAGLRVRPTPRLDLQGQGILRTWRDANRQLLEQGAAGADNTVELAVGGRYLTDARDPMRRPIRFGARYATLPFLLLPGEQPHEVGVSLGTGLAFVRDADRNTNRVAIDLSLEHVWRNGGPGYSERAFLVGIGVAVRP
ncbi:MAG TPA: hypothetical protein VFS40_02570 [Gemmatimonadales bacterium]|nr:hypothetical protein [Gemmatimonadales bacterium]